ncbi:MAG TPA: bifunctional DNA-formamidopyrimidine glycosylase/DNA-(apurinic or apyrimidinic site) lyase, partial [Acidocella sp.]|nr:bifunctional DNA-formamidopyrimidine glycosylase/DNA-(apurinic or apyrimidinic site) lyase [Acidocella sp.]
MPELPEVETVMRGLDGYLTGRVIARATLHRPDLRFPVPKELPELLTGATVSGFRRRGKYMFLRLDRGVSVLIHLGMSGRILLDGQTALHEHLTIETRDGRRVGLVDPRRFGALDVIATVDEDQHRLVVDLGPEPLGNEFSAPVLLAALQGKAVSIKAALLDQKIVAGIGNIYASEALFRARISPRRLAGSVGA